ncbi:hypothetical protein CAEBREN_11739 [Caenorhabditis brenneri]|uniref:Uncharacterized protein n=1 Tax=Caenorhabditis brenneri TaxID=135651 RepID=G0NVK6_CAEBE|nr:hypothetical protein CAEBREN_11739 [Caenorhabditis brenneri]
MLKKYVYSLDCDIDVHVQNGKISVQVENYDDEEDKVTFQFGHVSKQCSKTSLHAIEGRMLAVKCQPEQFKGVFDIWCLDTKCDYTIRAAVWYQCSQFSWKVHSPSKQIQPMGAVKDGNAFGIFGAIS